MTSNRLDRDALINASSDDVLTVALSIADRVQDFPQHLRLAGAMLFLQTNAELIGTEPQDVATVAANIRSYAERNIVEPGNRYRGLVQFLRDDVHEYRQQVAEEEGIELA